MPRSRRENPGATSHEPSISSETALKRLTKLLEQAPTIRAGSHRSAEFSTWQKDLKITLAELYGENSIIFREFDHIWFTPGMYYPRQPESDFVKAFTAGMDKATGFLESRVNDLREKIAHEQEGGSKATRFEPSESRRVFVVHGHDHGTMEAVARFLTKLELEPIILHEQADQGRTLIEKFESHAHEAQCAVVVLTADDVASSKKYPDVQEHRARQNVVLELGFFVGRLGRHRTFALVEKGLTLPSDIHGLLYIPLEGDEWRLRLVKELKALGLDVDANRAFS